MRLGSGPPDWQWHAGHPLPGREGQMMPSTTDCAHSSPPSHQPNPISAAAHAISLTDLSMQIHTQSQAGSTSLFLAAAAGEQCADATCAGPPPHQGAGAHSAMTSLPLSASITHSPCPSEPHHQQAPLLARVLSAGASSQPAHDMHFKVGSHSGSPTAFQDSAVAAALVPQQQQQHSYQHVSGSSRQHGGSSSRRVHQEGPQLQDEKHLQACQQDDCRDRACARDACSAPMIGLADLPREVLEVVLGHAGASATCSAARTSQALRQVSHHISSRTTLKPHATP